MNKLCLILAILGLPTLGFAQITGDSVIVYVNNRVEIKVAVRDYIDLKSSDDVTAALGEFVRAIPYVENRLSSGSADLINFSVGTSLTVEPGDQKAFYLIKDGEISNTGPRDHATISGDGFKILITITDLSKIPNFSLVQCLEKVIANLPEKTRRSKSLYYECVDENITLLEEKNTGRDFLKLTSSMGAGLVKNTWVPDISIKVAIGLWRKRTILNPYISLDFLYDFTSEEGDQFIIFYTLGYQRYIGRKAKKGDLIGIELGYANTGANNNLFGENALKFGLNWSPTKAIFLNPHFYFTDNFSRGFPAVRVGLAWGR